MICQGNKKYIKEGEMTFLGQVNSSRKPELIYKALYERTFMNI